MFAQAHSPQSLSHEELDRYLHLGWFRMGQTIFTTHFLNFKSEFYSAVWLRIDLNRFFEDSTQTKLFKRNASFRTEVKPASITPVQEALYEKYKKNISFEASASLKTLLFGRSPYQIYTTYEVNVYDGERLIGSGFFDIGKNAAAGISSFYDPEYKKFSLGKYLIYQKVNFCRQQGLQYFYPGYFVPGYSLFDYKLTIGRASLEYLEVHSGKWFPLDKFNPHQTALSIMRNKLAALQQLLSQAQVESKVLLYDYFDANLVPGLTDAELLDFPIILYCDALDGGDFALLVVYDVQHQLYKLIQCISVWSSDAPNSPAGFYSSHLLKIADSLITAASPEELVSILFTAIKTPEKSNSGRDWVKF